VFFSKHVALLEALRSTSSKHFMFSMKNAALVGLAAADRTLFTPVASPYGQVATPYEPAVASAYALSPEAFAQPVDFVQTEPPRSDSQTWLFAGAGALALVGAYAARAGEPSPVAALDEDDLESARIATLGVGGAEKKQGWSLTSFLMSGRKTNDGKFGELELLSGATRKPSDDPSSLSNRFKILYDTRGKAKAKKAAPKRAGAGKSPVTWRAAKPDPKLYK